VDISSIVKFYASIKIFRKKNEHSKFGGEALWKTRNRSEFNIKIHFREINCKDES
jgi:hypothetical protein